MPLRVGTLPVDVALTRDIGAFVTATHRHDDGGPLAQLVGDSLALAAGVFLVFVLEIVKLKRFRGRQLRKERAARGAQPPAEAEIESGVAHEIETGEFQIAKPPVDSS